jgi:hypothetical protein
VSVYFSADVNFTVSFFICIYTLLNFKEREVVNSNKEMYSVLEITILCHIVVLLLAVLQWR